MGGRSYRHPRLERSPEERTKICRIYRSTERCSCEPHLRGSRTRSDHHPQRVRIRRASRPLPSHTTGHAGQHPTVRRTNVRRGFSHPGLVRSQAHQGHDMSSLSIPGGHPIAQAWQARGRDIACYLSTECKTGTARGKNLRKKPTLRPLQPRQRRLLQRLSSH